jgi:hypothetical protein
MSSVLNMVSRVVHPLDVKLREIEIHVAGRDYHYVCGVSATEYVGEGMGNGHFELKKNTCYYALDDILLCSTLACML